MTPTPEQLAAVLPRCSAGLDGGDWTDDDDRHAWAAKVLEYVRAANRAMNTTDDVRATTDWLRSLRQHRDPHDVRHGDRWEARNGRATIVASNDWDAPDHPPAPRITYHGPLPSGREAPK